MLTLRFPNLLTGDELLVYIHDKARRSTLTSIRFVGPGRFVCCDFSACKMFLVEFTRNGEWAVWNTLQTLDTVNAKGEPVNTDLLDYDGNGRLVASNFAGSQLLYRLDGDTITFEREIASNHSQCHGVRFVGDRYLARTFNKKGDSVWQLVDIRDGSLRWSVNCEQQPQDVVRFGPGYVLVAARSDHISQSGNPREDLKATLYLYRTMGFKNPPTLVHTWEGEGHLDALVVYQGRVYAANQYHGRIDVFEVRATTRRIALVGSIPGFSFPHGLDITADGLMGVACYGDNTIRLLELGR